jgi:hypothetical protein
VANCVVFAVVILKKIQVTGFMLMCSCFLEVLIIQALKFRLGRAKNQSPE